MMPATLEPKSTSGWDESRKTVAKITPAKKMGTKTTVQDTATRSGRANLRKKVIGTSALTARAATSSA